MSFRSFGQYHVDRDGKFDVTHEQNEIIHRLVLMIEVLLANSRINLPPDEVIELLQFIQFVHDHSCYEDEMPPDCCRLLGKGVGWKCWLLKPTTGSSSDPQSFSP